jgi:ubiquitin carboxyl-terminal hydrolase L5
MEGVRDSLSPAAEIHVAQLDEEMPATLRRSGRTRKSPGLYMGDADSEDELVSSPTFKKSQERPRRNPKRKATPEVFDLPEEMLEAALAPVRPEELQEWEGWIELESDPSFFNVILRDLGVKDVKIQELFSVDEGSLAILPYVGSFATLAPNPSHCAHLTAAGNGTFVLT